MSSIGDGIFHEGEPVWVLEQGGSQRPAEYVGEGETNAWFGGPPMVMVVYADTRAGGLVETDRIIPRAI